MTLTERTIHEVFALRVPRGIPVSITFLRSFMDPTEPPAEQQGPEKYRPGNDDQAEPPRARLGMGIDAIDPHQNERQRKRKAAGKIDTEEAKEDVRKRHEATGVGA